MKFFIICLFLITLFVVKGSPESLMCYECDDCDVLTDNQLQTCPLPPNPPKPPTTKNPTNPSTESTKLTEDPTSSTQPKTTSTQKPMTQTVTEASTSSVATTTESPKSEIPSKVPQETEPPVIITESETRPTVSIGSTETQLPTNPISESPETFSPVQQNPSSVLPDAGNAQQELFTKGPPEIISPVPSDPQSIAEIQPFEPDETVNSFLPEQMFELPQFNRPYQIFKRSPREVSNEKSFYCYSIDILDGEKKKVRKGCIEVPEDKTACDVLKNEFGQTVNKCKICTEDKCNSSSSLKYSTMTFVMVLVLSFY